MYIIIYNVIYIYIYTHTHVHIHIHIHIWEALDARARACLRAYVPASVNKTPFVRALTMQPSSNNLSPSPDLVL